MVLRTLGAPPAFVARVLLLLKPGLGRVGVGQQLDAWQSISRLDLGQDRPLIMAWKPGKKDRRKFPEEVWRKVSSQPPSRLRMREQNVELSQNTTLKVTPADPGAFDASESDRPAPKDQGPPALQLRAKPLAGNSCSDAY